LLFFIFVKRLLTTYLCGLIAALRGARNPHVRLQYTPVSALPRLAFELLATLLNHVLRFLLMASRAYVISNNISFYNIIDFSIYRPITKIVLRCRNSSFTQQTLILSTHLFWINYITAIAEIQQDYFEQ